MNNYSARGQNKNTSHITIPHELNVPEEQIFPTHSTFKQNQSSERDREKLKPNSISESDSSLSSEKNVISSSSKDLLRPLSDKMKYKKEDLIKLHEFRRENIVEPNKELEGRDFFTFTTEDDPKYNFVNVKYFLRSKLLIKAIMWSFGIGCAFFAHRYYRKQMFWPALRWGGLTWTISMIGVWASLEFSPHLMAIFHSQFIKDLSMKDQAKYKNIGNMKQEEMLDQNYYDTYGVHLKITNNTNCEIAKLAYEYDSIILRSLNYKAMATDKIIKKKEFNQDDLFSEDFEEKDLAKAMKGQTEDEFDYDFSFHSNNEIKENCIVNTNKFFEYEKNEKFDKKRVNILKADVLSKEDRDFKTKDLLRREIINVENYLSGKYNNENRDFHSDPDYKQF